MYEIVTYVSERFWPCLKMSLATMLDNSTATKIVVYSDSNGAPAACGEHARVEYRKHFGRSDEMTESWDRKIVALTHYHNTCQTRFFLYLDADVFVREDIQEAFVRMGSAELGATRMFNNTGRGRGAINAGVLFFQRTPQLLTLLCDWSLLSESLKRSGKAGIFWEQTAISQLAHEAFDCRRPYLSVALPESVYNLEDDRISHWFARMEKNRSKLIHFKSQKWRDPGLRDNVRAIVARLGGKWYDRQLEPKVKPS